jgi:hypothetical protein
MARNPELSLWSFRSLTRLDRVPCLCSNFISHEVALLAENGRWIGLRESPLPLRRRLSRPLSTYRFGHIPDRRYGVGGCFVPIADLGRTPVLGQERSLANACYRVCPPSRWVKLASRPLGRACSRPDPVDVFLSAICSALLRPAHAATASRGARAARSVRATWTYSHRSPRSR